MSFAEDLIVHLGHAKHTFVFQVQPDGEIRGQELARDCIGFTAAEFLGWMRHALHNDVAVVDSRGVTVTARTVKITVEMVEGGRAV